MAHIDRDEAIERIKVALKSSGKTWSVTGGKGTSWGWITVIAPPKRREGSGMSGIDCYDLGTFLGMDLTKEEIHFQGLSISPEQREHFVSLFETAAKAKKLGMR